MIPVDLNVWLWVEFASLKACVDTVDEQDFIKFLDLKIRN